MIFVTGDIHGKHEVEQRFSKQYFPRQKELTKDDYVIICGDFGLVWNGFDTERYLLDWLEEKPFSTLWIDGNHENFDLLNRYPTETWQGGKVQFIRPSVIHLMRGQVFTIDGCRLFTMGGARSHDIDGGILEPDDPDLKRKKKTLNQLGRSYRINHISWWAEEMPNEIEFEEGKKNLALHENKVDYILTHEAPAYTKALLEIKPAEERDPLAEYLQKIKEIVEYRKWYFGHHHLDMVMYSNEIAIFELVTQIW